MGGVNLSPNVFATTFLILLSFLAPTVHARAWLYTFVSADHGGDLLLPHFVNHYHQLGITYRRFLILVHHTPGSDSSRVGLERITGICQGYSLECRIWEADYTPDGHLEQQLLMLKDFVDEPLDWIVVADADELQQWPSDNINDYLTDENNETQVTFFVGNYVERMALTKKLAKVTPLGIFATTPSLFDQFPLQCAGKDALDAPRTKVVAFKAYLRVNRNGRGVIVPDAAKAYFGGCEHSDRLCPRSTLSASSSSMKSLVEGRAKDVYDLTPYSWYENRYRYIGSPLNSKGEKLFWPYRVFPQVRGDIVLIHHFRWHFGHVGLMNQRLQRYKGTCSVEKSIPGCRALVPRWPSAAAAWRRLKSGGSIDTSAFTCKRADSRVKGAFAVNTAYMGLAWEEFEQGLNVESKVRNKVKGDSQQRLAGMLAMGEKDEEVDIDISEWTSYDEHGRD